MCLSNSIKYFNEKIIEAHFSQLKKRYDYNFHFLTAVIYELHGEYFFIKLFNFLFLFNEQK